MKTGVYFFLRPFKDPHDAGYQHRSIALAEGLRALGIPFFANIDYWKLDPSSPGTLFRREPRIQPEDCDILVAEHVYFDEEKQLPPSFARASRRYRTVFLDAFDGWRTPAMPFYGQGVDLVLRCHYNSRFRYGNNVRPWAFGLTQRILKALDNVDQTGTRRRALLCNYRASHPVRRTAHERFLPLLQNSFEIDDTIDTSAPADPCSRLMWEQTGTRHDPAYYARLAGSLACSAFGGYFVPSFSRSLDSFALRAAHKAFSTLRLATRTIAQFDSWRFWESLAAGCLTIHVDLEEYGCCLPVMPENRKHYIGVDLSRPAAAAAAMADGSLDLTQIARAGRTWAVEHYSPTAAVKRFLDLAQVSV